MKKANKRKTLDRDLLPEYDFRGGVRGKYAKRYSNGTNLVLLAPDVARRFPTAASVNTALRRMIRSAESPGRAGSRRRAG